MVKSNKMRVLKFVVGFAIVLLLLGLSALPVFAAGDVSTAIENTWTTAQTQIKNVVNNVVFPAVDNSCFCNHNCVLSYFRTFSKEYRVL